MKKIIILIVVIFALALVLAYRPFKAELRTNLALNSKVAAITDKVDNVRNAIADVFKKSKKKVTDFTRKIPDMIRGIVPEKEESSRAVTLVLKHGGVVTGTLIKKTAKSYTVMWKGNEYVIDAKQVKKVEERAEKDAEWPYKNDVVVKKVDGIVLDGRISSVEKDSIEMVFDEGGGELEMGVDRKDIDCLIFAPVCNKEAKEIDARLKSEFPKMKFYREGNVTMVTDSYVTSVNAYRKVIRAQYTDLYLKFFKLFKDKSPKHQTFIVVFDDFNDYVEYAATDGVPGWLAIGYFSPTSKVLYIFNAFGERLEKIIFEIVASYTGRFNEAMVDSAKSAIDQRYHVFIEGMAKEVTDKIWDSYNMYRNELRDMTFSTLRHELTHEIFHNWGFQSVVLSGPNKANAKKISEKKKAFLETTDMAKKKELFRTLMNLQEKEYEGLEMEAAQSWLAEGIATYCETDPIGSVDESWLYGYQEMIRKNELNPLEFLTNFKMGSFPGLCSKGMLNSYAESWAFTTFLMNKYPDQFIEYQKEMSEFAGRPASDRKEGEDFALLLKTLNKDLPSLEKEFKEYMATYAAVEEPSIKRFMRYREIEEDLRQSTIIGRHMSMRPLGAAD